MRVRKEKTLFRDHGKRGRTRSRAISSSNRRRAAVREARRDSFKSNRDLRFSIDACVLFVRLVVYFDKWLVELVKVFSRAGTVPQDYNLSKN